MPQNSACRKESSSHVISRIAQMSVYLKSKVIRRSEVPRPTAAEPPTEQPRERPLLYDTIPSVSCCIEVSICRSISCNNLSLGEGQCSDRLTW